MSDVPSIAVLSRQLQLHCSFFAKRKYSDLSSLWTFTRPLVCNVICISFKYFWFSKFKKWNLNQKIYWLNVFYITVFDHSPHTHKKNADTWGIFLQNSWFWLKFPSDCDYTETVRSRREATEWSLGQLWAAGRLDGERGWYWEREGGRDTTLPAIQTTRKIFFFQSCSLSRTWCGKLKSNSTP